MMKRLLILSLVATLFCNAAKADNWGDFYNYLAQKIDSNSIYNACDRLSLNKTDIERISSNLEKTLAENNIAIVYNTDKYRNLAK